MKRALVLIVVSLFLLALVIPLAGCGKSEPCKVVAHDCCKPAPAPKVVLGCRCLPAHLGAESCNCGPDCACKPGARCSYYCRCAGKCCEKE